MLTTLKPPGPEGTRGTFSPALAAIPAPPAGAGPGGQRAQGDRDTEDTAGKAGRPRVAGHIHSGVLTLLYGGQNLFWSLESIQVGFAVTFLRCMPDGLFIR